MEKVEISENTIINAMDIAGIKDKSMIINMLNIWNHKVDEYNNLLKKINHLPKDRQSKLLEKIFV